MASNRDSPFVVTLSCDANSAERRGVVAGMFSGLSDHPIEISQDGSSGDYSYPGGQSIGSSVPNPYFNNGQSMDGACIGQGAQ